MGHILYGFRRDEQGKVQTRRFDSDLFPAGWYDSPDKIDGVHKVNASVTVELPPEIARAAMDASEPEKRKRGRPPKVRP